MWGISSHKKKKKNEIVFTLYEKHQELSVWSVALQQGIPQV